jgi:hypothetical protein
MEGTAGDAGPHSRTTRTAQRGSGFPAGAFACAASLASTAARRLRTTVARDGTGRDAFCAGVDRERREHHPAAGIARTSEGLP